MNLLFAALFKWNLPPACASPLTCTRTTTRKAKWMSSSRKCQNAQSSTCAVMTVVIWISEWQILTENQTCQDPQSSHLKWWTSQPTMPSLNSKTYKLWHVLFSMQSAAHLRFLPICSLLQNDDHYLISQHKTTLGCVIEIKKIQRENLCKLISPPSKKKLWAFFSEQWAVRLDCYSDVIPHSIVNN